MKTVVFKKPTKYEKTDRDLYREGKRFIQRRPYQMVNEMFCEMFSEMFSEIFSEMFSEVTKNIENFTER